MSRMYLALLTKALIESQPQNFMIIDVKSLLIIFYGYRPKISLFGRLGRSEKCNI